ncbi:MAG: ABC transporter permease [Saprospiraceae bacterium]|nr:ABC transporter permease [Saprospiraceae bacterium]
MLKNYFKIAWRNLWKNRTTSFINIVGLSVGMAAAVLIMLWVQNEVNFDNYHKDSERIYRLTTNVPEGGWIWDSTPLLLADAAKKEIPDIEEAAKLRIGNFPAFNINGNLFYEKKCVYVDSGWFNLFNYKFIEGNKTSFNQNPFSIILTATAAKKYFNNRSAVGATIRIDSINYQVLGVVADAPSNSSFQYNAYIPIQALLINKELRENDEQWQNTNYITFIKLATKSNAVLTAQKLTGILEKNGQEGANISLLPLHDMHFETDLENSSFVQGNQRTVYIFSVVAFLLLLIACINYVNLATAKSSLRAKEVGIRKLVGAKRSTLFYQFIVEYVLISIISLVATLSIIELCLPIFNELTDKQFTLPFLTVKLWQIIGITLLAALLLNSIYPAVLLSSFNPLNVFRGINVLKIKDGYLRKGLVVLQFTVSVILITSTFIIYKQMDFIQQSNPGYNRSQVISFYLPHTISQEERERLIPTLKQALLQQSAIEGVTAANQPLVMIGSKCSGCADWDGRDPIFQPKLAQLSTDEDFLKTMQPQMQKGRWFQKEMPTDKHNYIINETAVKELNIKQPIIGQRFSFHGETGQIIGVVKDFKYRNLRERSGALIIFNNSLWYNFLLVRIAPKNITEGIAAIEDTWKKHFADTPIEYNFLDDSFNELYKDDQQAARLILVFAVIAVLISCLGLFGLAMFTAERRTKEIGIRKVLGANVQSVVTLLSKDFLLLVGIATLIAAPIAWYFMNQWLQGFAYRIPVQWWVFAIAGVLALAIALLTISFQAIRAAVANPVESLKNE